MSAEFGAVSAKLDGRLLLVTGSITNTGTTPWTVESGFHFGYHLFEEQTGTLIVDGNRCIIEPHFQLQAAIPQEPGTYQIYFSVLQEQVAWFYDKGWPFLLAEVSVPEDGVPVLHSCRVSTMDEVQRRRSARILERAVTLPLLAIWKNRRLIQTLVKRDVLGRYRGSFGGAMWAVLNPLLLMLTYFTVFGVILQSRFTGDPSREGFALYFLAGMLPWLAFSEAAGRAPNSMLEHRTFIKKLVFPVETLPVNLVASGLVTQLFGITILLVALALLRGHLHWTLVYLPLLLIPQMLFTAGVTWFLAALGVFLRDLAQINGFLLTLWFFITPICYEERQIPGTLNAIVSKNPLYILVRAYRAVILEGQAPDWIALGALTFFSGFVFLAGYAWFHKLRKSFADLI